MKSKDLIKLRLFNQQIAETQFTKPEEIVTWMGAMQAQEFAHAKWAIGLRLSEATETDINNAFDRGVILRTHLLRPTWHFVSPEDIRWMLKVTAPRVHAANKYMYRQVELEPLMFKRTNKIIINALEGNNPLTRTDLKSHFNKSKLKAEGVRLAYILMFAELEGIICSGPKKGKQFTYMLLEERVPKAKSLTREEGIVKLANRFFSSRGPASIKDFVYWSGLTMKEANEGLQNIKSDFVSERIKGEDYYYRPASITSKKKYKDTFLMPAYDEYGMSYKNRDAFMLTGNTNINVWPYQLIIIDGKFGGKWRAVSKNNPIHIDFTLHPSIEKKKKSDVKKAIEKYIAFHAKA